MTPNTVTITVEHLQAGVDLFEAAGWEVLDTRRWQRITEHFRWSLTWSLFDQWHLVAWRTESAWNGRAFDAQYRPDGGMRPEDTYDAAQGLLWAEAMRSVMTPFLEAYARGREA